MTWEWAKFARIKSWYYHRGLLETLLLENFLKHLIRPQNKNLCICLILVKDKILKCVYCNYIGRELLL